MQQRGRIKRIVILFLALAASARAEIRLDVPALDLPSNFEHGYAFPSMRQSLELSTDSYEAAHHYLLEWLEPESRLGSRLALAAFDVLSLYTPLGLSWMHEEWHRAVMSRRQIGSFDDVYHFPLFQGTISVSHVTDEDLAALKRDHPADFIRLMEAGIESQYEQNLTIERNIFFHGHQTLMGVVLWMNYLNSTFYLATCGTPEADRLTDQFNAEDGGSIEKRDFTGLDCVSWAYDLDRPNEPYSARGTHPSGVGINRYRKFSDLSESERSLLRKQIWLSLLNYADSNLLGIPGFGDETRWNATLRHHLTSFGYSIQTNLFYKREKWNLLGIAQGFFNGARAFPGASLELIRYPLELGDRRIPLTAKVALWLQPQDQAFDTDRARAGGLASIRAGYPINDHWEPYLELEGKTQGWVAGNVYLDPNISARAGFSLLLQ